jgi:hypothetical protein
MRSAGKYFSLTTRIMSPTQTSLHFFLTARPSALRTSTSLWFTFRSALWRFKSSTISLSAVKARMAQNGTIVTYRPVGDTPAGRAYLPVMFACSIQKARPLDSGKRIKKNKDTSQMTSTCTLKRKMNFVILYYRTVLAEHTSALKSSRSTSMKVKEKAKEEN